MKVYNDYKERQEFLRFADIKNKKILDIGAGKGLSSIILAKEFDCDVIVIDPLFEKIKEFKQNAKKHNVSEKINFVKGDITKSNFDNNYFDYVICYNTLHHIPKNLRKKALEEMYRISKYGFIISELNENGVYLFDTAVHPNSNHEKIKVNINWLESELNNLGQIKKIKKRKLTNFYWVSKK